MFDFPDREVPHWKQLVALPAGVAGGRLNEPQPTQR